MDNLSKKFTNADFLLQNLMDHTTDFIYFKDKESRFTLVNQSYCDWLNLKQKDILGKTDFDVSKTEHAIDAFNHEKKVMETGEPLVGIEEEERWPDGRITWVSTTKMPLKDESDQIIGTFGISRDITEHKEAELRATHYAKEIQRITDEMEEDVRMAGELQKTFSPSSYPVFPEQADPGDSCVQFHHYYHASGMVCGDFCSVRRLSDTTVGVFICDVMGDGVRAALGTALLCAMVEELSPLSQDPGIYLSRMNKLLRPILCQEDVFLYATACYLVLDVTTGKVRFANARHPFPLHFCEKEREVKWLTDEASLQGPALAISEDAVYQTVETKIYPGDSIVMFTDGLYEVQGSSKEKFGEERLIKAAKRHFGLPLPYLFPALINEASLFGHAGEFDDDVCLVGLKLNELMKL